MDTMSELTTIVPSAGVLGLLAWLIVRIMRQSSGDRRDYTKAIADLRERHDREISDLRSQVKELRDEIAAVRRELEDERRARHVAEDEVARYRRQYGEVP